MSLREFCRPNECDLCRMNVRRVNSLDIFSPFVTMPDSVVRGLPIYSVIDLTRSFVSGSRRGGNLLGFSWSDVVVRDSVDYSRAEWELAGTTSRASLVVFGCDQKALQ